MVGRTVQRALLGCGVVGPLLFLTVFSIEGALRPDYSAYHHYVSTLSIGERGWIQIANFLADGALLLLASLGWRRALAPGTASRGAPVALVATGIGLILAGVFVTGPALGYPPEPTEGASVLSARGHVLGALLAHFGVAATAFVYARRAHAEGDVRWRDLSIAVGVTTLLFLAASATVAALETSGRLVESPTGALQRVSIFVGQGWIAATSWKLWRNAR